MKTKLTAHKIAMDLLDAIDTVDDFFDHFKWPKDENHIAQVEAIIEWKNEVLEQYQQDHMSP